MKTLFPNVFTKHFYTFVCTLFFFLSVSVDARAQCPNGLTMSLTSDLTTNGTAIPFGTPITITTTVTNTGTTAQTFNLQLSLNAIPSLALQYEVLCANDYFWNGSIGQRNNIQIGVGQQVVSRMQIVYNISSANQLPIGGEIQATLITNNGTCSTPFLILPVRNNIGLALGTPGQTTVINSFLPSQLGATGSLIIRGNVTLNLDHTVSPSGNITDAYIYMDEGATLTIPFGRTLNLQEAHVFGIRTLWNSITVQVGGTLNMTGGTVRDGIRAINAQEGATINAEGTIFTDNLRSVYVAPTNPPSNGIAQNVNLGTFISCIFEGTGELRPQPVSGIPNCNTNRYYGYPHAGIDISDVGSFTTIGVGPGVEGPHFRNMSNGILALRSKLLVNNARFENIKSTYSGSDGLGVYSNGANSLLLVAGDFDANGSDFTNCTQAIAYENFGLGDLAQIDALEIDNTADAIGIGIRAAGNNFNQSYIYGNTIRAKTGIISAWNHLTLGEIYSNSIEATNPTTPSVSHGILGYENSTSGNWRIYSNFIDVQNAQSGMLIYAGTGAIVSDNTIELRPTAHISANGIQAMGASNLTVSCNSISGAGSNTGGYRSGMYISNGTGASYTCNNVAETEVGFNIVGETRPFAMNANQLNSHSVGLVLNDATFIGSQSLKGNIWQGPFIRWGAEHNDPNLNNIAQSRFQVGSPNAPIMPTFSPPMSNWFQVISGTDATCGNLNACLVPTSPNRVAANSSSDESFYASAISNARMQTPNAEEMKWTAQRNAYGRLMDNPSHQNNREKTNFVGRMRNTGMGQLYQIEKGIKDIQNIGQEYSDVLKANASTIKSLANEIINLDAKIFVAKGVEKTVLMARKKEKNAIIYRLSVENAPRHVTIERKRNQEIQRLMRENERISPRLQPEINEKEVNTIYFATVAQGNMKLNSEQAATVRLIAYQCPSLGGNAVFAARSLYSLVENVNFNDLELCGTRSELVEGFAVKRVETSYKVSPNPATDILTVNQLGKDVVNGEWLIFDAAGKLLRSHKVSESDLESTINIQNLSEGIYFVSFSVNGQKRYTQKLVKIKSN